MLNLFAAVGARVASTDLADALGGVYVGRAHADAERPYAVIQPGVDARTLRTNRGVYRGQTIDVKVVAEDAGEATRLAYLFQRRMLDPPLQFAYSTPEASELGERLLYLEEGNVVFMEEDPYWSATVEFTASVAVPRRG